MADKNEKSEKHKPAAPITLPDPPPTFVRYGSYVLNLAHVIWVDLPVEGDAKNPLTLHLTTGAGLSLRGDNAAAFLAALGEHCDCTPCKPTEPPAKPAE